jgi:hypothetical protein
MDVAMDPMDVEDDVCWVHIDVLGAEFCVCWVHVATVGVGFCDIEGDHADVEAGIRDVHVDVTAGIKVVHVDVVGFCTVGVNTSRDWLLGGTA